MKFVFTSLFLSGLALAQPLPEKDWIVEHQQSRWKIQAWYEKQAVCLRLIQLSPGPAPVELSLKDYPPGYRDGIDGYVSGVFQKATDGNYRLPLASPAPGRHRFEVSCYFRIPGRDAHRTDLQSVQRLTGWTHRF
jgi:hypothetical protein